MVRKWGSIMNEKEYMKKWLELNQKMMKEHFVWGALEEDDDYHQYMSFNVYKMKRKQFDAINEATTRIGHIVDKAYKIILNDDRLLSKLGFPVALDVIKIPSDYFSYFTRLDLIVNDNQIKVIEVNCDTPTGYLETSVANRIICEDQGLKSPNYLEEAIHKAWRKIVRDYGISDNDTVYFTSYGWHDEDRETVLFNMRHSGLVNKEYIPIEDIIVSNDGAYTEDGRKIEYLYRLYPLEYLPDDIGENGEKIGNIFLDHVAKGKIKIINPPSAFVMQSKAVMSIIWSFVEENRTDLFTDEELNDIRKYFLPTYFDNRFMGKKYVRKPIYGREGGGVHIFDERNNIVDKDKENWYDEWPKIYQEYVEMPEFTLDTWTGKYTGKLLVGSFLIGGETGGLFLRVGERITGNLSMFCGVTVV
jgi:glutathionylspermidine synthase